MEENATTGSIEELPTELILLIVNFISDLKTYFNFSISCKQLFNICLDESVKNQKFLQLIKVRKTNSIVFNDSYPVYVLANNIVWKIPNYSFPSLEQYEEKKNECTISELIEMIDLKIINSSVIIYCYSSKYATVEILWLLWRFLENKLNTVLEGDKTSLLKFQNSVKTIVKILIDWIQLNPSKEWTRHPYHPSLLYANKKNKKNNNNNIIIDDNNNDNDNNGNNNNNNIIDNNNNDNDNNGNNSNNNIIDDNNNDNDNDNNDEEGKEKEFDLFTHQTLTSEFLLFYKFLLKHNPIRRLSEELINVFEEVTSSIYSPPHDITKLFLENIFNDQADYTHEDPIILHSFYEEFRYNYNLLDIPSNNLIDFITRIEIEIYKDLCAFEFHECNWSRTKTKHLSITILKFIKCVNIQANSFLNYLLSYESIEILSIIYSKIIEMFEYVVYKAEIRNLNLALYLYHVLKESAIYRLRLDRYCSPIFVEKLEEIGLLFDSQRSYSKLREKISEFKRENINYIPPIGIFLTDLVFVYDVGPNSPPLSCDNISIVKWKTAAEILPEIFIPIQSSMKKIVNQTNIDENSVTFQFLLKLYTKCAEGNNFNRNYYRSFARSLFIFPRSLSVFEKLISFFPVEYFDGFVNYINLQNMEKLEEKHAKEIIDILRLDQISVVNSLKKLNESVEKGYRSKVLVSLLIFSQKYWLEVKNSGKDQNYLNFFRSSFILPIQMRILCCIQQLHKDEIIPDRYFKPLLTAYPDDLAYLHYFAHQ